MKTRVDLQRIVTVLTGVALAAIVPGLVASSSSPPSMSAELETLERTPGVPGQVRTLLPDGRWLLTGGEGPGGPMAAAIISDPATGETIVLAATLQQARAWHTATVMPDGTVLIVGGIGVDGHVLSAPEGFDPAAQTFTALTPDTAGVRASAQLTPRAAHTATLLTDGRVLIAGGVAEDGTVYASAELWDPRHGTVETPSPLSVARYGHTATLLADGVVVLWGGVTSAALPLETGDRYDPATAVFTPVDTVPAVGEPAMPALAASRPADGTSDVPTETDIALRFSEPLAVATVNADTIVLLGPDGVIPTTVVGAEGGRLAFVTPRGLLIPGATYALELSGPADGEGRSLTPTVLTFITREHPPVSVTPTTISAFPPSGASSTSTTPGTSSTPGSGPPRAPTTAPPTQPSSSDWRSFPPLKAPAGITAIAGQVLRLNAQPLAKVTLRVGPQTARTDASGRFLLPRLSCTHCVLLIDGASASAPEATYGTFEVGVDVVAGKTTVLPYTIWMPKLDTSHPITVPSPALSEVVLTTPRIPGLDIDLPPHTVLRDRYGQVVSQVTITPLPIDRPPFPLPNVRPPVYFTLQPGGTYVDNDWGAPARIVYPNPAQEAPGFRLPFWDYDADERGWYVYGFGSVAADGHQIVPESGVGVYEFSGAMAGGNGGPAPPSDSPTQDPSTSPVDGDPVDVASGLFVVRKTDLFIPDIIPISLTRVYRTNDRQNTANQNANQSYPFGAGMKTSYDIYLYDPAADSNPPAFTEMDLVLPDGAMIKYERTSPGSTTYQDAVFAHRAPDASCPSCVGTPTPYYASTIVYDGHGWDLLLKDDTHYLFNVQGPLEAIQDRYGNTITLSRDQSKNPLPITRITSPSGRYIDLTVGTPPNSSCQKLVLSAVDNTGALTVCYQYDAGCRLQSASFLAPSQFPSCTCSTLSLSQCSSVPKITYSWQTVNGTNTNRIKTITDLDGITFLTNTYSDDGATAVDLNARITKQTNAEGKTYVFQYGFVCNSVCTNAGTICTSDNQCTGTLCGSGSGTCATHVTTNVTDPRKTVRQLTFDGSGYTTKDVRAMGNTIQQVTQYARDPGSHEITDLTEALGDPLQRTTHFIYDTQANVNSITRLYGATNPDGTSAAVTTSFSYDPFSQVHTISDPLSHVTMFGHDNLGNLRTILDASGRQITLTPNERGQVTAVTDALGDQTQFLYHLGDLIGVIDPLANPTTRLVDEGGKVIGVLDPLKYLTLYSYDWMNHLAGVTDGANDLTQYLHDNDGNLTSVYGPNVSNPPVVYGPDSMNRVHTRTDPLNHVDTYSYEPGSNVRQLVDRRGYATTYNYDALGRQTFVGYNTQSCGCGCTTYDSTVTFQYDSLNRLTQVQDNVNGTITRAYDGPAGQGYHLKTESQTTPVGSATVTYMYDAAGRRTSMSVPAPGPSVIYGYDNANRLTSVTWAPSYSVSVGYDPVGRRQTVTFGNGWSQTYGYDADSHIKSITYANATGSTKGTLTYTYDDAGRRTGVDGTWARMTDSRPLIAGAQYNAAEEIQTWNGVNYQYDTGGNLVSDGTYTYTWNSRGQLSAITSTSTGAAVGSFQYDGLGRRIGKSINGGTTIGFIYDGWNVIQELNGGSVLGGLGLDERYAYVDGLPVYLLTDALNSTVALVDPSGNLRTQFTYDPFGDSNASYPAYQYTGRENDGTGLYYYRARYYSPKLGRFISEDTVKIGMLTTPSQSTLGDNPLSHLLERLGMPDQVASYANDDPTLFTDPRGLWFIEISGTGSAVAGSGVTAAGGVIFGTSNNSPEGYDGGVFGSISAVSGINVGFGISINYSPNGNVEDTLGLGSTIGGSGSIAGYSFGGQRIYDDAGNELGGGLSLGGQIGTPISAYGSMDYTCAVSAYNTGCGGDSGGRK